MTDPVLIGRIVDYHTGGSWCRLDSAMPPTDVGALIRLRPSPEGYPMRTGSAEVVGIQGDVLHFRGALTDRIVAAANMDYVYLVEDA